MRQNPLVTQVKSLFLADPSQYHGKAFVTPEVKQSSRATSTLVTSANWFNIIFFAPVLGFIFRGLGPAGLGVAGASSLVLLVISNLSGELAARRSKGENFASDIGLLGLLSINLILSSLTGVGTELIVNLAGLQENFAEENIDQIEDNLMIQAREQQSVLLSEAQEQERICGDLNVQIQELTETNPDSPERDRLILEATGSYADRDRDWMAVYLEKQSISGIPSCKAKDILREEANNRISEVAAIFENRDQAGDAQNFLLQEFPEVYAANFTEEGDFLQGSDAVQMAWNSFFGVILSGEFINMGRIGFSLLMFILSVLTSLLSCLAVMAHGNRRDVQLSHSEKIKAAILSHLEWLPATQYWPDQLNELDLGTGKQEKRQGPDARKRSHHPEQTTHHPKQVTPRFEPATPRPKEEAPEVKKPLDPPQESNLVQSVQELDPWKSQPYQAMD